MAEYRVFQLRISKKSIKEKKEDTAFREVLSTLDPMQYLYYYQVEQDETVTYVATWKCKNRTSHLPLCANPKLQTKDLNPPNP